jgi:hypothetical protein
MDRLTPTDTSAVATQIEIALSSLKAEHKLLDAKIIGAANAGKWDNVTAIIGTQAELCRRHFKITTLSALFNLGVPFALPFAIAELSPEARAQIGISVAGTPEAAVAFAQIEDAAVTLMNQ